MTDTIHRGEFKFKLIGLMQCTTPPVQKDFQYKLHLHKVSANTTEIRGFLTHAVPYDDSYDLEVNLAVKDSIGGWKENSIVYRSKNTCSTIKYFYGKAWIPFMKGLGFNNFTCPLPAGNFTATGADPTILVKYGNFPKVVFYGTYKYRQMVFKNKELRGCLILNIEIKRPWEQD